MDAGNGKPRQAEAGSTMRKPARHGDGSAVRCAAKVSL